METIKDLYISTRPARRRRTPPRPARAVSSSAWSVSPTSRLPKRSGSRCRRCNRPRRRSDRIDRSPCPVLALSGHANGAEECLLSGLKRTLIDARERALGSIRATLTTGVAKMPPTHPTSSVITEQLTRALGEAVIRIWSNLPQDVQNHLFQEAVTSQGESIRSQLAVFLHDKHSRTADPLGDPRQATEPDSHGG